MNSLSPRPPRGVGWVPTPSAAPSPLGCWPGARSRRASGWWTQRTYPAITRRGGHGCRWAAPPRHPTPDREPAGGTRMSIQELLDTHDEGWGRPETFGAATHYYMVGVPLC